MIYIPELEYLRGMATSNSTLWDALNNNTSGLDNRTLFNSYAT
jgi:hypothetical protein